MNEKEYVKKQIIVKAYQTEEEMQIETLEGTMTASPGDYIITGVNGEQYPCKPDVFHETYDELELVEKCAEEPVPKMNYFIDYTVSEMCRALDEQLSYRDTGSIFIIFKMGSIRLNIANPENWLSITRDYIEIHNDENGELTFIKIDDLTGFVLEPEVEDHVCEDDECNCEG